MSRECSGLRPATPQVSKNGRELISQHPLCKLFLFQYKSKPFVVLTAARPRAASARVVFVCVLLRVREKEDARKGADAQAALSAEQIARQTLLSVAPAPRLLAEDGGGSPGPCGQMGGVPGPGAGSWQLSGSGRFCSEKSPWALVRLVASLRRGVAPSGAVSWEPREEGLPSVPHRQDSRQRQTRTLERFEGHKQCASVFLGENEP